MTYNVLRLCELRVIVLKSLAASLGVVHLLLNEARKERGGNPVRVYACPRALSRS